MHARKRSHERMPRGSAQHPTEASWLWVRAPRAVVSCVFSFHLGRTDSYATVHGHVTYRTVAYATSPDVSRKDSWRAKLTTVTASAVLEYCNDRVRVTVNARLGQSIHHAIDACWAVSPVASSSRGQPRVVSLRHACSHKQYPHPHGGALQKALQVAWDTHSLESSACAWSSCPSRSAPMLEAAADATKVDN